MKIRKLFFVAFFLFHPTILWGCKIIKKVTFSSVEKDSNLFFFHYFKFIGIEKKSTFFSHFSSIPSICGTNPYDSNYYVDKFEILKNRIISFIIPSPT
jgi:hypothetical protein